ncbi:P-loop containing nucleoside triphosphate hydrolase protein [Infundibulicybe gibba]|nr:P-loop containing nucleoside triphosphate hydrolase protein [Infundibulicybe gibba]
MGSHTNLKGGFEEAFVDIKWPEQDTLDHSSGKGEKPDTTKFYGQWLDSASAKHSNPLLSGADILRRLYPKHSLVVTTARGVDILSFPDVSATPLPNVPLITDVVFIPLARSIGSLPGVLVDQVQLGGFRLDWKTYSFIFYTAQWPVGTFKLSAFFILHEGPEDPARALLLSAGVWSERLHDEIWVFDQGFWRKDHGLWAEVQKADWKDVILKDDFKKALQKDVYGFFTSEEIYKELAIPWKRGLILYGPPGNGKTISLKAIMKTCGADGFAPLYVKSFKSYKGEEGAMADVFDKARQLSPCVVVLEDLDSLINDENRSFFLNQLDGLEGNNGLLIIGTTNHFDRLDPGMSTRPSRFDRKLYVLFRYSDWRLTLSDSKFDDPDREERALYAKYWQRKLENNKDIDFPDSLVNTVAEITDHFSFAYLKEAFVSSLVILVGYVGNHKPTFESVLKAQIKILRNQLDKSNSPLRDGTHPLGTPGSSWERTSLVLHQQLTQQFTQTITLRTAGGPVLPMTH